MAEIFLAGVLVSFVKLMAYGSIGVGSSFLPRCLFCVLQLRAFQCVDRRWLWDDIAPMPELRQPLKPGVTGIRQGCVRVPVVRQSFLLMNPCARVVVPKGTFGVETACNGHSRCL